jgi:hypothetical protein
MLWKQLLPESRPISSYERCYVRSHAHPCVTPLTCGKDYDVLRRVQEKEAKGMPRPARCWGGSSGPSYTQHDASQVLACDAICAGEDRARVYRGDC